MINCWLRLVDWRVKFPTFFTLVWYIGTIFGKTESEQFLTLCGQKEVTSYDLNKLNLYHKLNHLQSCEFN